MLKRYIGMVWSKKWNDGGQAVKYNDMIWYEMYRGQAKLNNNIIIYDSLAGINKWIKMCKK